MPNELTITNLECVVTKLRLEPGDVLVVRCDGPIRDSQRAEIGRCFEESIGVPAMVLPHELTLEAVLNVPPELIERAKQLGDERHREFIKVLRKCGVNQEPSVA